MSVTFLLGFFFFFFFCAMFCLIDKAAAQQCDCLQCDCLQCDCLQCDCLQCDCLQSSRIRFSDMTVIRFGLEVNVFRPICQSGQFANWPVWQIGWNNCTVRDMREEAFTTH